MKRTQTHIHEKKNIELVQIFPFTLCLSFNKTSAIIGQRSTVVRESAEMTGTRCTRKSIWKEQQLQCSHTVLAVAEGGRVVHFGICWFYFQPFCAIWQISKSARAGHFPVPLFRDTAAGAAGAVAFVVYFHDRLAPLGKVSASIPVPHCQSRHPV